MSGIRTIDLSIGYHRHKSVVTIQENLNISAEKGELIALIGPNGCGKSTLIRTLSGLQQPLSGSVLWGGTSRNLREMSQFERSRMVSLVLTEQVKLGYATVRQLVSMGRHPYTTLSGKLSSEDVRIVESAMESVHLEHYAQRPISELSDGERQRVMIAKALAQDTPVILLDEPTSFLDLPNRIEIMLLLQTLAHNLHKCILLSTHEIDLAIRLADTLWLMEQKKGVQTGTPGYLTNNGAVQAVFHGESFGFDADTGRVIIF
jgi:iron complex transport system ATP-binding protein